MSMRHLVQGGNTVSRRHLLALLGGGGASLAIGGAPHTMANPASSSLPCDPWRHNRLVRDYSLTYPVVGAGMGFVALPELVAAVSEAGGLGVLGVAPEPPPVFAERIAQIRALTDKPFGVDFFLVESPTLGPVTVDAHIDIAIAQHVSPAVFHFDIPSAAWINALQGAGIRVWAQVPSVEEALAALEAGVDVLIAQGTEAGGHSKSVTPLKQLLREIRHVVHDRVMILAAGGIATGADVVAALAHGADGVWVGSRFVASDEAYAHPEWKQRLVDANQQDTVITTLFGPELPCLPFRTLRNRVVHEFIDRDDDICGQLPSGAPIGLTTLFPETSAAIPGVPMPPFSALPPIRDTEGDFDAMAMAAGESVHRIHDIKPAARIMAEMMADAQRLIEAAQRLCADR